MVEEEEDIAGLDLPEIMKLLDSGSAKAAKAEEAHAK